MPPLPPKQLSMVIDDVSVSQLPDVPLPVGYFMRAYRPGDASSWADALQQGGFGNSWNEERVLEYLRYPERKEGSRLVEHNGRIAAATFASRTSNRPNNSPEPPPLPLSHGERGASKRSDASGVCPEPDGTSVAEVGVLDYVVTHPDHRGKGLGRATCTEVARFLVAQGCKTVSLDTDDWRLPAIHIYLSLGFRPVMNRSDMPPRWAAVYENLQKSGRSTGFSPLVGEMA